MSLFNGKLIALEDSRPDPDNPGLHIVRCQLFRGDQSAELERGDEEEPERFSADDVLREMQSWSDSKLRAELRELGFLRLERLSRPELQAMLAGARGAKERYQDDEPKAKPEPAPTLKELVDALRPPERYAVMVTEIVRDEHGRPLKTIQRPARPDEL